MIISDTGNGTYEQLDEGMYPAIAVLIAGVGTQRTPFKNDDGTDKVQKKMIVQWETEKGLIAKEYTVSLNEKANLRKDLESWRGKRFTDEELKGFDMSTLLGKGCTIQVMHNDNGYAKVANVLPVTNKDFKAKKPAILFDIDNYKDVDLDKLPAWIQKKVNESFEAREKSGKVVTTDEFSHKDMPADLDEQISLDDIPF